MVDSNRFCSTEGEDGIGGFKVSAEIDFGELHFTPFFDEDDRCRVIGRVDFHQEFRGKLTHCQREGITFLAEA